MRFYPFGSASAAPTVASSSLADYATTAKFIIRVNESFTAISGSAGPQGPPGSCSFNISGSSGSRGPSGSQGPSGTVDGPFF